MICLSSWIMRKRVCELLPGIMRERVCELHGEGEKGLGGKGFAERLSVSSRTRREKVEVEVKNDL